jgi:hypothetical protein
MESHKIVIEFRFEIIDAIGSINYIKTIVSFF